MDSYGKYCIIEFDDGLQLVPKNWISKDGRTAYWPNFTSFKAYDRAVFLTRPPKKSWNKHPIKRIVESSSDYLRGKRKLEIAEMCLNLSSDEISGGRKRARQTESVSDSEEEWTEMDKPNPATDQEKKTHLRNPQSEEVLPSCEAILSTTSNGTEDESSQISKDCQTQMLQFMMDISLKLDALMESHREILQKLNNPVTVINGYHKEDNYSVECMPQLPAKSVIEVESLEAELEDERIHQNLVSKLKTIGGRDPKDITVRILKALLVNAVADEYSWLGTKKKKIFSTLKRISRVIEETVRFHKPCTTDREFTLYISNWLRHAKDRKERDMKEGAMIKVASQQSLME